MGSEHPQERRSSDYDRQSGHRQDNMDARETDSSDSSESVSNDSGSAPRVQDADSTISASELFELLARPGNRYTLAYLSRADGAVPYEDLVEYVVDEGGTPEGLSTAEFRNQVATRLIHSNLPKLDDAGLIEYDSTDKMIRSTEVTEVAVPYLDLAMEQFSAA